MSENDKWFCHEGLDRTHMLLVMLNESLGFVDPDCDFGEERIHPAIWNKKCKDLLSSITSDLCELYQEISKWEEQDNV